MNDQKAEPSIPRKDYATDVLSFPSEPEAFEVEQQKQLGEVIISVQHAAAQARGNGSVFK